MVPTLLLVGLPSYSKVLSPYFNLIWSTDLLGRLSCSLCSLALLVVHLLLLWCREKISIALTFSLWLIKVVAIPLSCLGWKMAVLLLLLEKFLPSTLFWIQEQNSSVINCMRTSSDKKYVLEGPNLSACWYSHVMGVSSGGRELPLWEPSYVSNSDLSSYPHFVLSVSFLQSAVNKHASKY